jgi:hypothetical protein
MTQQPLMPDKKISAYSESSDFLKSLDDRLTRFKSNQIYLIKLATDFY